MSQYKQWRVVCVHVRARGLFILAAIIVTVAACGERGRKTAFQSNGAQPDVLPVILSKELPFRYPPSLYTEKVQGKVMLRLYVDSTGNPVDDSTTIVTSSTVPLLDSAAVQGAHDLRFVPAKRRGVPVAVSILLPVLFRHPDAVPPADDTLLRKVGIPDSTHSTTPSKKP